MEHVEKVIEVNRPVSTVYNQWTQFEEFPMFMDGVKEVRQISWKSIGGAPNAGTVRFEPLGEDRTQVRLVMAYEPEGAVENAGDALGLFTSRVEHTIEEFKRFIESRGTETGGWRGEVGDSQRIR
jgi:uncharacterized membrane protein